MPTVFTAIDPAASAPAAAPAAAAKAAADPANGATAAGASFGSPGKAFAEGTSGHAGDAAVDDEDGIPVDPQEAQRRLILKRLSDDEKQQLIDETLGAQADADGWAELLEAGPAGEHP